MRKNRGAFWGIVIILAGIIFMLDNLGFLPGTVTAWGLIFSLALILAGVWVLVGPMFFHGESVESQQYSIPLEGAASADVRLSHGAGRMEVSALGISSSLLEGTFGGGVEARVEREQGAVKAKLRMPHRDWMFGPWPTAAEDYHWRIGLNPGITLRLRIKTGASENQLDLRDLRVSELSLETGASATEITLPAQAGYTRAEIHAGAARVSLRLPDGVAGRIHMNTGLSNRKIDSVRFPISANGYETPGFDTAPNRAEIFVEAGVGEISIL